MKQQILPENFYVEELGTKYQLPVWKVETDKGIVPVEKEGKILSHTLQFVRGDKRDHDLLILSNSGEQTEDGKDIWLDEEGNRHVENTPEFYLTPGMLSENGKKVIPMEEELDIEVDIKNTIQRADADGNVHYYIPYTLKEVTIPRVEGIVYEALLGVMIQDLSYKNELVPSRETSLAITKLEEAALWLAKRSINRRQRNVQRTYKK